MVHIHNYHNATIIKISHIEAKTQNYRIEAYSKNTNLSKILVRVDRIQIAIILTDNER